MLGARYLLSHAFAIGGRGEYYHDDDGLTTGSVFQDRAAAAGLRAIHGTTIFTGTVTLDYLPTKNLVLRLDNPRRSRGRSRFFREGPPRADRDARDHDARCRRLDELARYERGLGDASSKPTGHSISGLLNVRPFWR